MESRTLWRFGEEGGGGEMDVMREKIWRDWSCATFSLLAEVDCRGLWLMSLLISNGDAPPLPNHH